VDVQARQLAVAEASVGAAAAGIERALAEVARAEAGRVAADLDLARTENLVATGALQQSLLDAARERADRSTAERGVAQAAVLQARRSHDVTRASVAAQARVVGEGVLRSPVEGVVTRRQHEPGDVVAPGAAVFQLASSRRLWARVWVDETALASVALGAPASVVLRGQEDRPLRARVDRVAPEADRQTHQVLVDLELLQRPDRVTLGQRAEAAILLEKREGVAVAPRTACDTLGGRCWAERDGRISEVPVAFGLAGGDRVEIVRGLAPGDRLVDRGALSSDPPPGRRVTGARP
jgi:HlyD family secretion protein